MGQILENINKNLNKLNNVYNNGEKDYQVKHYAIFFNNGAIIQVDAMSYEWDDDIITFYDTPENEDIGNKIATFKTDVIYGVSSSYDILNDYSSQERTMALLPCYEHKIESEEE